MLRLIQVPQQIELLQLQGFIILHFFKYPIPKEFLNVA
jgi:hypothetical protein